MRQGSRDQPGDFEQMINVRLGGDSLPFLCGMLLGGKAGRFQHIPYDGQFRSSCVSRYKSSPSWCFAVCTRLERLEEDQLQQIEDLIIGTADLSTALRDLLDIRRLILVALVC
jgi:hypothetical protein